jgi:hypothetical protein
VTVAAVEVVVAAVEVVTVVVEVVPEELFVTGRRGAMVVGVDMVFLVVG